VGIRDGPQPTRKAAAKRGRVKRFMGVTG